MFTRTRILLSLAFIVPVLLFHTSLAGAGNHQGWQTYVQNSGGGVGNASGVPQLARTSTDPSSLIECSADFYKETPTALPEISVRCHATNYLGVQAVCRLTGDDAKTVAPWVSGIGPTTLIQFEWDATGRCVGLSIHNSSRYIP